MMKIKFLDELYFFILDFYAFCLKNNYDYKGVEGEKIKLKLQNFEFRLCGMALFNVQ